MHDYLKVLWHHYGDFMGRAGRREFWTFMLVSAVIGSLLALPLTFAGLFGLTPETAPGIFFLLGELYVLAVVTPSLALLFRRLHDTKHSGGWLLLVAPLVAGTLFWNNGSFLCVFLLLPHLATLLVFTLRGSHPQANRWGEPPV